MFKIQKIIDPHQPLRFEHKYFITHPEDLAISESLVPGSFTTSFKKRQVNSLYFDTPDLLSYHQSMEGAYYRWKIRIRWYGEYYQSNCPAQLEIKYKRGALGGKKLYPLKFFSTERNQLKQNLIKQIHKQIPPHLQTFFTSLDWALSTSYDRTYYEHQLYHPVRLTIDSNLKTSLLVGQSRLSQPDKLHPLHIIELKYSPNPKYQSVVMALGQILPTPPTRFSKYTWGMGGE